MTINLSAPELTELKPRIVVIGVGGAGGNAVNNMIDSGLEGAEFIVANTDAQALALSRADRRIQLGASITQGLGCGARPDIGRLAAEEAMHEILDHMTGTHMAFVTAGMGGGTGTGAAPVIAQAFRENNILTIGVVTKPFQFEGSRRMMIAEEGIEELQHYVDTLIVIPNQNLFRIANEKTTFADAFTMADNVLHSGVRGITDLMVVPGLINLDFADVKTVMAEMGKAMMGTGEADGERRAIDAAESAISNPLLDEVSMKGARGVLINITGGLDLTLYELDEAANRIREEVDPDANIIVGSALDESMNGAMRVSVVATGIDVAEGVVRPPQVRPQPLPINRPVEKPAEKPEEKAEQAPAAAQAKAPSMPAQPAANTSEAAKVDGPRISEIMSRLEATRRAVPKAKPISPEPQAVAQPAPEATPAPSNKPFIAPEAMQPEAEMEQAEETPAATPDIQMSAPVERRPQPAAPTPAPAPAVETPPRRGRLSLFKKMTGGNRVPEEEVTPVQVETPAESADSTESENETTAEKAGFEIQPPNPSDRPEKSNDEEDLLEIPSFLRRQAN